MSLATPASCRVIALVAGLLFLSSFSASSRAAPRSVHPALSHIEPGAAMSERFLSRGPSGEVFVELILEGDVPPGTLRARGIEVNTVVGRFMTARCPLGLLTALLAMPGIDRVQVADRCKPSLDQSIPDASVDALRTVPPPDFSGQTGAGVLVAIVDSGIDLVHGDFRLPDGRTRLLYVWDQTATGGTPPSGFTYGAEWDSAAINDGLSSETNPDGHGTHVLGIAAGDGSATGNGLPAFTYVGVAPQADLMAVKSTFATTAIVDGVSYIFAKAASLGKQAVVNLSLGTRDGPHDGTYGFDTMINALTGPGRIVVAAAGNGGEDDTHGQLDLSGTTPQSMTMNVPTYTRNAGVQNDFILFTGWYEGGDQISMTITTPGGTTIGPIVPGASSTGNNTTDGYVNAYNSVTAPSNGDNEIYVEIFDAFSTRPPGAGTWTFRFTPLSLLSTGVVDMYIFTSQLGSGFTLPRWAQGLAFGGVVESPASADSVIAVAAHTTKDCWNSVDGLRYCWNPRPTLGAIASFSSQGPRRDGVLKPDLSAPGFGVTSAKSSLYGPPTPLIAPDGVHHIEAGTSMSAPHVTGAVGLLLAKPAWAGSSPSGIKQRLRSTARGDAFTGMLPNATWGYGKLDAAAAAAPLFVVTVPYPPKAAQIPPGKPDSVRVVLAGGSADSVVIDLSLDGGSSYTVPLGTLYAVPPGAPRKLEYFVDASMVTLEAKVRATAHSTAAGNAVGHSDSLFIIEAPVAVEVEPTPAAPRFALEPNRPNPFNPVTTIRFEIPRAGRATLRIYSVRGTLVRTLVDEPLPAGRYSARWDGRDDRGVALGSGVYLYELDGGGRRASRKMSLLK